MAVPTAALVSILAVLGRPFARGRAAWARRGPLLPRGWRDLALQVGIFAVVDVAYELTRVLARGSRESAMAHTASIVAAERSLGLFHELDVQRFALHAPSPVLEVANLTYFNCQFTVTVLFLLWVYLRRNGAYARVRNVLVAVNLVGLVGYVLYPAAPPRMLASLGFVDTLRSTSVNHDSGVVSSLANPYAAMPSLHTAYALTLGVTGVLLARRLRYRLVWAAYPALVVFAIIATGNHFVLDAVGGAATAAAGAALALVVVPRLLAARRQARRDAAGRPSAPGTAARAAA